MDGHHSVPFDELFNDEFMLRNSDFDTIDTMFQASGFNVESSEDFEAIPDEEWETFVRERTRFDSWEDMKAAAVQEWATRRLGVDE